MFWQHDDVIVQDGGGRAGSSSDEKNDVNPLMSQGYYYGKAVWRPKRPRSDLFLELPLISEHSISLAI